MSTCNISKEYCRKNTTLFHLFFFYFASDVKLMCVRSTFTTMRKIIIKSVVISGLVLIITLFCNVLFHSATKKKEQISFTAAPCFLRYRLMYIHTTIYYVMYFYSRYHIFCAVTEADPIKFQILLIY